MRAHSTLSPKLGISLKKVWPLPHAMREPRGKRVRAREKESRREKKRKKRPAIQDLKEGPKRWVCNSVEYKGNNKKLDWKHIFSFHTRKYKKRRLELCFPGASSYARSLSLSFFIRGREAKKIQFRGSRVKATKEENFHVRLVE